MVIDGYTLPCYFADVFCKPTTKTPFLIDWFVDDFCLISAIQDFFGRMIKINERYWVETLFYPLFTLPNKSDTSYEIKGTSFPYIHAPHTQNQHNSSLSRFELFPHTQTFCGKPESLYSTQHTDFLSHTKKVSICIQVSIILVL